MSRADITIVRTFDELEALAPEWSALSEVRGTPLLDHDWFASAARALHREEDLRVVTVRQDGILTAVAPMVVHHSKRHLVLLGSSMLYEPGDWLYASAEAVHRLTAFLVRMGQPIVLDRIPAGSASCQSLQWRMWWKAVAVTRPTAGSFLVHTNLPWDAYCASLSGRFRKKLAANRSKAGRAGAPVRFSRIDAGPDEVAGALALFTDVESRGWKARHGTALALRPDLHRFFQLYTERAAARRRLRVSVVWIDERPAAVELGLEAYGRMWSLKIGYDERFAAFSPGTQLVHASIGAAHQSGLTAYEFLGAAEPWQKRWRPHSRGHQLVAIYPIGPRAMATACRDVTGHLARRIQTTIRREEASPLWRPALDDTTRV